MGVAGAHQMPPGCYVNNSCWRMYVEGSGHTMFKTGNGRMRYGLNRNFSLA